LIKKILGKERFKKINGINDTGTDDNLKVDIFCYQLLDEQGFPDRDFPEYLKFKEFRKLGSPWILSEKEVKTYSKFIPNL
jgi:hypothetical protein